MPLRQFIRNDAVFAPDDLEVMTAAFDEALRRLGLKDRTDKVTELVARNIIALAKYGERDPAKLCDGVLTSLSQRGAAGPVTGATRGEPGRPRSK
ncbi:MAG TPA: hypothetical protein VK456_01650 [Xanthobacteraceae bacterium]|nr:hypothetical protein [Xanthobacteraceae bacterium]